MKSSTVATIGNNGGGCGGGGGGIGDGDDGNAKKSTGPNYAA